MDNSGGGSGSSLRQIPNHYFQSALNRGGQEVLEVYGKNSITTAWVACNGNCPNPNCACKKGKNTLETSTTSGIKATTES